MIRIGLPIYVAGNSWMGGLNYFKSLARALNLHAPADLSVRIITNDERAFADSRGRCVEVVGHGRLDGRNPAEKFFNLATATNATASAYAKMAGIDIYSHFPPFIASKTPAAFWMPDFQHKALPGMFSGFEKWRRDRILGFTRISGHIILSSRSSEEDFRRYYPKLRRVKAHVLRFAPLIEPAGAAKSEEDGILAKYGIVGKYFFLPNQFWKHKNHGAVVEALSALPPDFKVVCTGAVEDYRNRDYVGKVLSRMDELGLKERMPVLGMIPRGDMQALMRRSIAVINPSRFEGWSTTVEEAKYMGKRLILSDLRVHREQSPADALYFGADEPEALARAMESAMSGYDQASEDARSAAAKESYALAVREFAEEYCRIIVGILGG